MTNKDGNPSFDEIVEKVIDINKSPDKEFDSDGLVVSVAENSTESVIEEGEIETAVSDQSSPTDVGNPGEASPIVIDGTVDPQDTKNEK